jgi:ribonuclease R
VRVTGIDQDGEALAQPAEWAGPGPPPRILMQPEKPGQPALAPGATVMARLRPAGFGRYEGRTLKRVSDAGGRVLGVFRRTARGARIEPIDRRVKAEWTVPPGEENGAEPGDVVEGTPLPARGFGLKPARVTERLGRIGDAGAISLLAVHLHDIPDRFSPGALAEAAAAEPCPPQGRTDLREMRLVTIDGEDARDFDDAVFAEADGDGFRLLVAIADVAHYVRPASGLDTDARGRGNSVYFPDRVVPMLPEALSNGLCSLRPGEDRGVLFAEMRIDARGALLSHRFGRGLMRSAARLTYAQVQEAQDGGRPAPVPVAPLYAAFRALLSARTARGTLDLDLPERMVVLGADGRVADVQPRPRLDSHRLIEEFMVLANVCAAETLERLGRPCLYRVHAPPSPEKLEALRDFLKPLGLSLPQGNALRPRDLGRVLEQVAGSDDALLVNEVVLRSQSQAAYSFDNLGHFGLALPRYAHFTSPIRRYADLVVHRALIAGLGLGAGGDSGAPDSLGQHLTATERRAALAERDATDRYLAAWMQDQRGASFAARVSGVTRAGLFVTVLRNGASGLVPISTLPDDFWMHDDTRQALIGRRSGLMFRLSQAVQVILSEANPNTGGLLFQVVPETSTGHSARSRRRR